MPEKKTVHFLPVIEPLPHRNMVIPQPPKKHEKPPGFFGLSRYHLRSKAEQEVLNHKAEIAALNGHRYEAERYRRKGASLYAFAREVGISGDVAYAEFLVQSNPQEKNLVDELALGFYAGFHLEQYHFFCRKYQSSFLLLAEQGLENKFLRKKSAICDVLKVRLESARSSLFRKLYDDKKNLKKNLVSSSEESFTLSS
ncbi:MAG: hypothetical protein Q8L78_05050 [Coxiellaceae bacterium]|nr:hypothetical protein [Coxiellaceae bacterium]